jgi:hypothetical protein
VTLVESVWVYDPVENRLLGQCRAPATRRASLARRPAACCADIGVAERAVRADVKVRLNQHQFV